MKCFFLLLCLWVALPACADDDAPEVRAVWATRWDFKSPEDVEKIVYNAASLGCNRIYMQVRGEATCFFRNSVEPWAWELTPGGVESLGTQPSWDPLATMLAEAKRYGMEVHAWANVLPAWKQDKAPPKGAGHVLSLHPDWIMVDRRGRVMDVEDLDFYAFLNPAIPEVREHIRKVFRDLAAYYPGLHGIHLDYIRYPGEMGNYSHDSYSLSSFAKYSDGKKPQEAPDLWVNWRVGQINQLLAEIYRAVKKENGDVIVSAATEDDYQEAREKNGQAWLSWPDLGLVDELVPMAYQHNMLRYERHLGYCLREKRPRHGSIIVGLYPALKWRKAEGYSKQTLEKQVDLARQYGAEGICLFAYSLFFPEHKANSWALFVREELFEDTKPLPGALMKLRRP